MPLKALFAFLGTLAAVTATVGLVAPAHPNLSALKCRFIGPDGNRAIAVVGEPGNPNVAYIGAASGGIFKTTDGGTTWKRLGGGLPGGPDHPVGKVAVGVAPSNSERVYVEDTSPGFYRWEDGGASWKLVSQHHTLERAPYYTRFAVAPDDANRIYFASVRFSTSIDEGQSIVKDPPRGGGDNHDI